MNIKTDCELTQYFFEMKKVRFMVVKEAIKRNTYHFPLVIPEINFLLRLPTVK